MRIAVKWQVVGLSRISKINLVALLSALGRLANAVQWRIMVDDSGKTYLPVVAYCLLYICAERDNGLCLSKISSIFSVQKIGDGAACSGLLEQQFLGLACRGVVFIFFLYLYD